jgi:hypothetical protein
VIAASLRLFDREDGVNYAFQELAAAWCLSAHVRTSLSGPGSFSRTDLAKSIRTALLTVCFLLVKARTASACSHRQGDNQHW